MKIAVPLAKNVLAPLATMESASEIHGAIQRKMSGKCVMTGVEITASQQTWPVKF